MSFDPKAAVLARQLGQLMKAYLPGALEGHDLLELAQWFQAGLKDATEDSHVRLQLPMEPAWALYESSTLAGKDAPFDLKASHLMQIDISGASLAIEAMPRGRTDFRKLPRASIRMHKPAPSDDARLVIETFSDLGQQRSRQVVDR